MGPKRLPLEYRVPETLVAVMLVLVLFSLVFAVQLVMPYCAALCLAATGILSAMFALRCDWRRPGVGDRLYLWICYERNAYDKPETEDTKLDRLSTEVRDVKKTLDAIIELFQQQSSRDSFGANSEILAELDSPLGHSVTGRSGIDALGPLAPGQRASRSTNDRLPSNWRS